MTTALPTVTPTETLDRDVRVHLFRRTAETGRVPRIDELAGAMGLERQLVEGALARLAAGRVIVLAPGSPEVWMAAPFSAVPTGFRVEALGRTYWGNCIWDALGIPAILGADAVLTAPCGDCGDPLTLEVRGGELARDEGIIHFGVPAARWWDNVGFT